MKRHSFWWFILSMTISLLSGCGAPRNTTSGLNISDAWTRPTVALGGESGSNSAVYLTIRNDGEEEHLLGGQTDIASALELHVSQDQNGVMSMRSTDGVTLPPNSTTTFQPGGTHMMLIGIKRDLKANDSFDLTLRFQRAGNINVRVLIRQP